jgi:pimeloyl-ACP methyl ester carboxylesterase
MSFSENRAHRPDPCTTVVLLHSSAGSARQWERLVEALRPRLHVRAVEFHGHGDRPAWRGDSPLTLADEAALVVPLLADAGGAHVVGHSYGAAVALKLASLHPRLVRSLIAYEPVMFRFLVDDDASRGPAQEIVAVGDAIRDRLARGEEHPAAQRFIDFWSGAGSWDSLRIGTQHSIATHMHAVLQHFDALFGEPLQRVQLARLRVPMLFMSGTHTVAVMRRLAQLLRLALPHAHHEVLQGIGHMGPITHAAEVNRRILEFLHTRALSGSDLEPLSEAA